MRGHLNRSRRQVRFAPGLGVRVADPRVAALMEAIRRRQVVRLDARSTSPVVLHPVGLVRQADGWAVVDEREPDTVVPQARWGTVNVSAKLF